jgi:uncharacterized protein (DUF849 family)
MSDLKNKRIITVATTGAWPQKKDNPNVPLTPAEIADDVYSCWKAGAAICHIHVRNDDGTPYMNFDNFKKTVELIRARKDCDIVINLTTSGGGSKTEDDRMKPFIELKPELATYDCGTMNWQYNKIFDNNPKFLEKLGRTMQEHNVRPEIECFDPAMIYDAAYYLKQGVLKAPLHFQFCMGVACGIKGTVKNLVFMKGVLDEVAPGSTWSTFGVGASAMPIMYAAIAMGGHIRVGMEDNVLYSKGVLAESNTQFVKRAKHLIEEFGCEAATPDETRQILGLK